MQTQQEQDVYTGHLREQDAQLERIVLEAGPVVSRHRGAPDDVRSTVKQAAKALHPALVELSHDIHAHPELLFEERYAAATVAGFLRDRGHVATVGAFGLDTAVVCRAGRAGPTVAVLCEYDALPGIGHACGHNWICATTVGAFLALTSAVEACGGSVVLLGTPGEEGGGGKELMARAGALDGVDAAIMVHPSSRDIATYPLVAMRTVDIVYAGETAHASAAAYMGRNALDAAVTAYQGIAQLRQHILPADRLHGVITDGGGAPNVVPANAALSFMLRSEAIDSLLELSRRAEAVFTAAATSTGTDVDVRWDPRPAYLPMRHSHSLAERYCVHLHERGREVVGPGLVPPRPTGSTDAGNLSVRVPTIHPFLTIAPPDVPIHHSEFARHARGERADSAILDGALGLALTAADFLCDELLRDDVATEFAQAGGVVDVEALFA